MVFSLQRIWLETQKGRYSLLEKCQYSESFWSVFFRIRTEYGEILRISPYSVWMENTVGKIRARITPNTDTFYAVIFALV